MAPRTRTRASTSSQAPKAPNGSTKQKESQKVAQISDSESGSDIDDILESVGVCKASHFLSLYFVIFDVPAELLISSVEEIWQTKGGSRFSADKKQRVRGGLSQG